jgi:transcriptional regulator with PAS, ATPase and Fis domain
LLASAERRRKASSAAQHVTDFVFEGMIAASSQMWQLFSMIQRIAPHYRSVLVQGPTGTGKDLIANALHRRSLVPGRFIVVNCSAVVETLFESEIFGHVRGAFTGADRDKIGLLELANGGTLFLDEIGDMPLSTQAKLLRVLQNQEVLPVGSLAVRKVDVRVIAATHHDLHSAIAEGKFREDLYYRLSMVELSVPALKEHPDDIPLLARHFVHKFGREFDKQISGITPRAEIVLQRHSWPGNVRELEHVIGRACMLTENSILDVHDLPEELTQKSAVPGEGSNGAASPLAGRRSATGVRGQPIRGCAETRNRPRCSAVQDQAIQDFHLGRLESFGHALTQLRWPDWLNKIAGKTCLKYPVRRSLCERRSKSDDGCLS